MQKSKLGITVGALGAVTYFVSFFSGYLAAVVIIGYVLLMEEDGWLRRSAVKAMVLMLFFSVANAVLNLIPDAIGLVGNVVAIFHADFMLPFISNLVNLLSSVLKIVEKLLFLGLGLQALNQKTIVIPFVDSMVSKFMN